MKITGFDDVKRLRTFSLAKRMNHHCECSFSFVSGDFERYKGKLGESVRIIEDDRYLMFGAVSSVEFLQGVSEHIITVTVCPVSVRYDEEKKTRVFQKQDQSYKQIVDLVAKELGAQVSVSKEAGEKTAPGPVVQLAETDFAFLVRLAEEGFHTALAAAASEEGFACSIGGDDEAIKELKMEEFYSLRQFWEHGKEGIAFSVSGNSKGQELRQYAEIGRRVSWNGKKYQITDFHVKKKDGVYRFHCIAVCQGKTDFPRKHLKPAYLFHATVEENKDPEHRGRIRLDFSDDLVEDMTKENRMWFDVWTPYLANNGGFVFIPDVRDDVEAFWDGYQFYIVGSRRRKALEERYRNVDLKQIGNLHQKNICFSKEALELSAKDTKAVLKDDSILLTVPNSEITVTKDEISVTAKSSKIRINDDVILDSEKVHIDAKEKEDKIGNNYICESRNITLNASLKTVIQGKAGVSIN